LKDDLRERIKSSDAVVAMAIANNFTFLVWNQREDGRDGGAEIYTIRVQNKEKIGEIEPGMLEGILSLSREESDRFTAELMADNRESFLSSLIGKWGSRF